MPLTEEELKTRLMAEAETVINGLVADAKQKGRLTITEIERMVGMMGQRLMTQATTTLIEAEGKGEDPGECQECGQKLRYKGLKGRNLITETGEVRYERGYYYCPGCGSGFFPPGPSTGGG
jgi:hypothetical protein